MKDLYKFFDELKKLTAKEENDERVQWYIPSGHLWPNDYGRGFLVVIYHKPHVRHYDCVFSVTSVDDFSFSAHGKLNSDMEYEVQSEIDDWVRGMPDFDAIIRWANTVGLYINI